MAVNAFFIKIFFIFTSFFAIIILERSEEMEKLDIISFKHDGELHRVWKNVYKVFGSDDLVVIVNDKVDVIDGDGHKWKTKEPAICYFFRHYWFNIICMIRDDGIYYYCNLSSPFIIDQEGLKYIDYDLDVKLYPDGEVLILDRDEYDFNIKDMNYSEEIVEIIRSNLNILLDFIKEKQEPFAAEVVYKWYDYFLTESKKPEENK
jgi:protein associated with RNAse G/E